MLNVKPGGHGQLSFLLVVTLVSVQVGCMVTTQSANQETERHSDMFWQPC
jgi:hypothetical protein